LINNAAEKVTTPADRPRTFKHGWRRDDPSPPAGCICWSALGAADAPISLPPARRATRRYILPPGASSCVPRL